MDKGATAVSPPSSSTQRIKRWPVRGSGDTNTEEEEERMDNAVQSANGHAKADHYPVDIHFLQGGHGTQKA
ncbi:hypothetical protein GCM10027395_26670 [Giesbergeria sinuosa]